MLHDIMQNKKIIKICLIFAGVWFFFRYLLTLIAPFLFAFLLITLCYPMLERIQRKIPIRKKFLAVGIILPLILLMMEILWTIIILGGKQLEGLPAFWTQVSGQIQLFFHQCCGKLDGKFGWKAQQIENYVIEQMTVFMEDVEEQVMPRILASSYQCFKGLFAAIGFLAITCIASILLEKEYANIMASLRRSEELRLVRSVVEGVLSYIINFLKAQGVIMLTISVMCGATLGVAGVSGGILLGILAGVLDVLPFIGTGVVLVPLAIWQMLGGEYVRMTVCLGLYVVCIVTRELLEPKLIGKRMGIAPVFMLLAIYAGVKLFGVGGIVKGPLALIVIVEILKAIKTGDAEFDERESLDYD